MSIAEIKKRTEEIKSYDYSWVERYINEKTRFDGTAINDHKKELVGSVEYLLSIIEQARNKSQVLASHLAYCADSNISVQAEDTFDKAQAIYELLQGDE